MPSFNAEDQQITATAHHVLSTFGGEGSCDMPASFDTRFSDASSVPPLYCGATAVDAEITDPVLRHAQDMVFKWDSGTSSSEASCQSFIWAENLEEAPAYLAAVDALREFTEKNDSAPGCDPSALNHARSVLQIAMLRLEDEFRNLLEIRRMCPHPDFLIQSASSIEVHAPEQPLLEQKAAVDLLPPDAVSHLRDIASRMMSCGYQAECMQAFAAGRRLVLEECLQRLGLENRMMDEVQRMPWEVLESEIGKWIRLAKVAIGVLFHSEKELCRQVFFDKDAAAMVDSVFADVAMPLMMQLLRFPEAVSISRRAPERLFKIMDMYEALVSLSVSVESLFVADNCESLRTDAASIRDHLADAVRGTFAEFKHAVQRNPSKIPLPGGGVHPLTKDVMNYVKLFSTYAGTLNQLLESRKSKPAGGSDPSAEGSVLGISTRRILDSLDENLNAKSKMYRDPALSSLFLMNNLHYMVQKSKDPEVWKLVGDDWIKRHSSMLLQHHNDYRRSGWSKVVACLRDEGINVSGSGSSGASRNVLRERLKNFAVALEEIVKTQSGWMVSDSQLCAELQISITEMILPAYRSFLGRFQNHLDARYPEKYIKYTAEDVESELGKLFEGKAGSMNRRKAAAAPEGVS